MPIGDQMMHDIGLVDRPAMTIVRFHLSLLCPKTISELSIGWMDGVIDPVR